jgi:hypothetical protein
MPWRGPEVEGEWPTLGYLVGEWIESHLVIGDGYRQGDPYLLTDEMWKFLVHYYRLWPDARIWDGRHVSSEGDVPRSLRYTGAQLRRSQKWGKDPLGAAVVWAEALGPSRFDGWDSRGEPVGKPYPTPLIVELGTTEDQTDNTWVPTRNEVLGGGEHPGPLATDRRVLAVDLAKIDLSSGGKIEPVTTSAKSRLGAPMTFITLTESHLFTMQGGYRKVAGAVKRNVAGMDGRWLELTNAWDPTEGSEAQATAQAKDPDVYIDTVEPIRVEDLADDYALMEELRRQYGDSARERGGWVNLDRIASECRSSRHLESDRRRFFLNEIVVGESTFVLPEAWDARKREGQLEAGESVALGFDGSKYRDATALVASRVSDGRLFELAVWERPELTPVEERDPGAPEFSEEGWRVPSAEVDRRLRDVFEAYSVVVMFADPYRWQDYLDAWAALWPDRVVEFPTNVEQRMDRAIERFMTAFGRGEITHDGGRKMSRHVKNTVVVKGSRKKPRPGEDETLQTHYLKLAKRDPRALIDGGVAAVLAHEGRAHAIEHSLVQKQEPVEVWGFFT